LNSKTVSLETARTIVFLSESRHESECTWSKSEIGISLSSSEGGQISRIAWFGTRAYENNRWMASVI